MCLPGSVFSPQGSRPLHRERPNAIKWTRLSCRKFDHNAVGLQLHALAYNLGKRLFKRGPISKIRPSDGCGKDTVLFAVARWNDFPEFEAYLGNVELKAGW